MATLTLLALCVALAAGGRPTWRQLKGYTFERYVADFGKSYRAGTTEYARRAELFYAALKKVEQHNAQSGITWHMGINHMSDWTHDEFTKLNGARRTKGTAGADGVARAKRYVRTGAVLPHEVDYRNRVPSVLTAVKDQGMCGSCWAHGATEQMESYAALATGKLMVLSQQQVTACTPNPNECGGTGGCGGATAELAYEYVAGAGLTTEWFYPYTAHNGTTGECLSDHGPSAVKLSGYVKLAANDQASIMEVLATVGPLAVNVDASEWQYYESGIYNGCKYNITIDHVVQLVGYGTDRDAGADYWIIRNSWTPFYGEDGYIRLHRSSTPTCGWDINPQDGTGCKGGPPQMWACGMCGILMDTSYPVIASS